MEIETKIFTIDELRDLKTGAIARKHRCTTAYVRMILIGERDRETELAKKIVQDAIDMFAILERETNVQSN